jgi:hypothetical protein
MTPTPRPTTETAFGPAEYSVSADGSVYLSWPAGITLHRVKYPRAHVYGEKHGERHSAQVYLDRECWQDKPTDAARAAVYREHERLAPLLATPERVACARLRQAEDTLKYAERDRLEAEAKEARARAALEDARATLAQVQEGGSPA